jgi:protein-tyrosine-phosphatase
MSQPEPADASGEPTTYNLLFVCTGNTCRSPMAAAAAQRALAQLGWKHVAVASAGLAARPGEPAADTAVRVAAEQGLDISDHETRSLTPDLVEWADLILGMSPGHLLGIAELGGAGKAALITDFLDGPGMGQSVPDPFGGDAGTYRRVFTQIDRAIAGVLQRLAPILAP